MLEGRFGDTTGAPYLEARVFFPRLKLRGLVSFLVDTGATVTVLMPSDSRKLGIDFISLRNPTTNEGIGGIAKAFKERAVLSFSDRRYVYSYLVTVRISAPTSLNHKFPSLLGRDIIRSGRLIMDCTKRNVMFTPYMWSLRQKI
jgi:hypothetical protein